MRTSKLDDRGRATIHKRYRDRLGDAFVQVLTPRGILLRPLRAMTPEERAELPDAAEASGEDHALDEVA